MTLREKMTLFTALLLTVAFAVAGGLLASIEARNTQRRSLEAEEIMLNSVRRAASDAILQKDELLFVSYIKFLQQQFPSLGYCDVTWREPGRVRAHRIGPRDPEGRLLARSIVVNDPLESSRRVQIIVGVDTTLLRSRISADLSALEREMFYLFAGIVLLGVLFADYFARNLTRPMAELSAASAEIGRGRLGVKLQWRSGDEIGALVDGFNRMSERLEELDSMKRDFVSSVTHELRSPLGAIESFLNLIEARSEAGNRIDSGQLGEYMARIKANVRRLSGFINDLLDVAKIERGKMECALRAVRGQDIVIEVLQFFEAKAAEQGIVLSSSISKDFPDVMADPDRLRQVLVNLISNALKFTPRGGRISVEAVPIGVGPEARAEFSVRDTGAGIDRGELSLLFSKFTQGKGPVQIGPKGTGLGLYIVKSIVEAHGGAVGVDSAPGKGSRFYFSLSFA